MRTLRAVNLENSLKEFEFGYSDANDPNRLEGMALVKEPYGERIARQKRRR